MLSCVQTIARLALPRVSILRPQAVEMLAFFLAMPWPDPDHSRSPTRSGSRGPTGRWGRRVGSLGGDGGAGGGGGSGGGGTVNTRRSPRLSSDHLGEEESALEGCHASSTSSSSLAGAASFVYR